jgi:hypothetical protein
MNIPKNLLVEQDGGRSFRDPTKQELAAALVTRNEILLLRKTITDAEADLNARVARCRHVVRFDKEGHIYDIRTCLSCGQTDLI